MVILVIYQKKSLAADCIIGTVLLTVLPLWGATDFYKIVDIWLHNVNSSKNWPNHWLLLYRM